MSGRHAYTMRQLEGEIARRRVPLQTFGITDPDARRRTLVCRLDRARFDVGPYVGKHRDARCVDDDPAGSSSRHRTRVSERVCEDAGTHQLRARHTRAECAMEPDA